MAHHTTIVDDPRWILELDSVVGLRIDESITVQLFSALIAWRSVVPVLEFKVEPTTVAHQWQITTETEAGRVMVLLLQTLNGEAEVRPSSVPDFWTLGEVRALQPILALVFELIKRHGMERLSVEWKETGT